MRLRTKILLSHALLATMVVLVCGLTAGLLRMSEQNRRQLQDSYQQVLNLNLVLAEANSLFEQVAELLILGPDQVPDIEEARASLLDRIDRQRELIEAEMAVSNSADLAGERSQVVALERVVPLMADLERATTAIAGHLAAGRQGQAVSLYTSAIDDRFDQTMTDLIEELMTRERIKIQAMLSRSAELSRQSALLVIVGVTLVGTLGFVNAFVLHRAVLRPVASLTEGADAVARGEFDHVITAGGSSELDHLARRFNHMTAQVRDQHDRLMEVQAGLEEEVASRTSELRARSQELEAANARLRAVDASRAQFFADISHELRTPITILRGQAEVALRRPAPTVEEQNRTLEAIVGKAAQIGRLVDDLLFLARSDEGTIGVELGRVVLQEVVGDVLLDSQGLPRREEITIRPHHPQEPIVVRGDADRLRQVLVIALDNALKLAPAGTTVDIELDRLGDQAVMRVRDEGPGFNEDEIASAFTRFYRGNVARARTGRGMGLGLSIAKWIVERHGGSIRVASAQGAGAVVEVALPLAEVAEAAA